MKGPTKRRRARSTNSLAKQERRRKSRNGGMVSEKTDLTTRTHGCGGVEVSRARFHEQRVQAQTTHIHTHARTRAGKQHAAASPALLLLESSNIFESLGCAPRNPLEASDSNKTKQNIQLVLRRGEGRRRARTCDMLTGPLFRLHTYSYIYIRLCMSVSRPLSS